ncbi:hypothetical protein QKU48_gp0472 [Fadolivirus algeromassiliense]|jgi:hypothetical protein|uniref:Uncharacterized protein n=1 Tax=Fadolivirus FV1/VV64 TaxID=3070911 RepID=A0A7D3USX7_9VIRU|nr:hypothetical protein QKU48_gp0472 [Fadolivirus algeromassiliense]QKF93930.1 hypothetical protein Fadolivirus_1_472 [Fadolivirus FV1/VV64]
MQYSNIFECFNPLVEEFTVESRGKSLPYKQQVKKTIKKQHPIKLEETIYIPKPSSPKPSSPKPSSPKPSSPKPSSPKPSKQIKPPKIKLPMPPKKKPNKYNPPVELPAGVSRSDWWPWWRENRWYYGDRDYYIYLGYPLWWIDYYYPEFDYDYPPVIYTEPTTTIIQTTEPQQIQDQTQIQQQLYQQNYISSPIIMILMISMFGILGLVILFLFMMKKN